LVIDFHTHTFPDKIADKAIASLQKSGNVHAYRNGKLSSLLESMKKAGIDKSVVLPIASNPGNYLKINEAAKLVNEENENIVSFGSLHPNDENYKEIIKDIKNKGLKGIKLHPFFQNVYIDDPAYFKVIDCAYENDLIVLIHGGDDVSFANADFASAKRLNNLCREVKPLKLVLAHMGAHSEWDKLEDLLYMDGVYFDTAFTLHNQNFVKMTEEEFIALVRKKGVDRILFGTDSPWEDQSEAAKKIKALALSDEEKECILYKNALKLLM